MKSKRKRNRLYLQNSYGSVMPAEISASAVDASVKSVTRSTWRMMSFGTPSRSALQCVGTWPAT